MKKFVFLALALLIVQSQAFAGKDGKGRDGYCCSSDGKVCCGPGGCASIGSMPADRPDCRDNTASGQGNIGSRQEGSSSLSSDSGLAGMGGGATITGGDLQTGKASITFPNGQTMTVESCARVEVPGLGVSSICLGDFCPNAKSMCGWPVGPKEPVWLGRNGAVCTRHDILRATWAMNNIFGDIGGAALAQNILQEIFGGDTTRMACAAEFITKQCKQKGRHHSCYASGTGNAHGVDVDGGSAVQKANKRGF